MEADILIELLRASENPDSILAALEQLSFIVLQMESTDSLKKLYPPSIFVPILVNFFLDTSIEPLILETAARVVTYYLQCLSFDSIAPLIDQEMLFSAIAHRVSICSLNVKVENDLSQQLIKARQYNPYLKRLWMNLQGKKFVFLI